MSRFEHLPIYKQAYSLLVEFHNLVPNFPRKYKFEIGSKIINDLTESILIIIEINSKINKKELIEKLILIFEKVLLQIRIIKSLEIISKELYFNLSDKIIQLLKQSEGWKKNVN